MDNNDTSVSKVPRKTYSRELLRSLQNSELSNLWPKSLDKTCINCHNQWDPVKSFENNKTAETKRTIFPEPKTGYRNNDKNKDDISLRPERRRWNDGCQVSSNTKRNSDDIHSNSFRKSYQNSVPNCGSGDYDRNRFNRNSNRTNKPKETDNNNNNNNITNSNNVGSAKQNTNSIISNSSSLNTKPDKSIRNNSNIDEKKDEKEQELKPNLKSCMNSSRLNNRMNHCEPEWFVDGPDNCDETIELGGIPINDSEMMSFKSGLLKQHNDALVDGEKLLLNLPLEKSVLAEACVSPKREGSRFQDIFLKEKKINHLNESKDVENILKAVLSDNVSKTDAERLNNVSKPLPNGVLTLEEIEKNMTSGAVHIDRQTSKSTAIDGLNSFESSFTSLLATGIPSPGHDNSKVVKWLSGLNAHAKEPEIDLKQPYINETQNYCNVNPMINPQHQLTSPYSKFAPTLPPPPGLPLMLNNNQLQQQQQSHLLQQQQQNKMIQSAVLMKQLQMSQPNNNVINHNIQQRNILPYMFQPQNSPSNEFENSMNDNKYKINHPSHLPNESNLDHNMLSNYLKNKASMNHINHPDRSNHMLSMNGPPGLTNLNLLEKNMIMQPRPIVKTSSPQLFDMHSMNDFKNFPNNIAYQRSLSANNPIHQNMQNMEMNKTVQLGQMEMLKNLRNRELLQQQQQQHHHHQQQHQHQQHQSMIFNNFTSNRQSFIPSAHEMNIQNSSSNKMLANLFNVSSSTLPPLPLAKYADQIETENI